MNLNVIITGSTGMVGKGVLYECLEHPQVNSVMIVNRSPLGIQHEKLTELLVPDFMQIDSVKTQLAGYNCCFFCAGISSAGMSEKNYSHITYDITIEFAKAFLNQNPDSIFCYVSGAGTDSTEKGRSMWARVKGRTENALLAMPFKHAYMFRPGYIQPERGIRSKTRLYDTLYSIFKPVYIILKRYPASATSTSRFGKAMINVCLKEYHGQVLGNREINEVAEL